MTPSQPIRAAQATPDPAPEIALRAAGDFARRIGKRRAAAGAPVRNVFVSALADEVPPLAALLRGGGRGGVVRLKLYLSLLWVCAAPPYQASYPARAWAALFGLPHYETKGVRRIQEATRDLVDHHFISVQDRGGKPSLLTLLDESGSGEIYIPPSDSYNNLAARKAPLEVLQRHRYFKIPSWIWTSGYMARLSGPGLAMLLVLHEEQRGQAGREVWFTPQLASDRFRLASSTRTAGIKELRDLGLVRTRKTVVSHDGSFINFHRRRNVHALVDQTTTVIPAG
ncbi:hypothetical protein ACQP2H_31860 (plasmid) [Micromonospora sp. CA-248260]|uniref:hypothetical protein n=1 Tax=Micromonospora sp. CA-248260 TaxID=3239962 RepID=UPI003D8C966E